MMENERGDYVNAQAKDGESANGQSASVCDITGISYGNLRFTFNSV